MAINKTVVTELDDSVSTSYHKVRRLEIDTNNSTIHVLMGSYISKTAFQASKEPVRFREFHITFADLSVEEKQKLSALEDVMDDIVIAAVKRAYGEDNDLLAGTKDT